MVSVLFCQQKTAEEMAKILFLSKRTVEGIKEKIKKKLEQNPIQVLPFLPFKTASI